MTIDSGSIPTTPAPNERLHLALARANARGYPHYAVASLANIAPAHLSRWLNGHSKPNLDQAIRVADVLGERASDLFDLDRAKPRVAEFRALHGMSQVDLARRARLDEKTIARIEAGDELASEVTQRNLAEVLLTTVDQLFYRVGS